MCFVSTRTIPAPRPRHKGRKARTNRGQFGSLERRYWSGTLTDEEQERFEALVCMTRTLYREVRV